MNKPITLTVCAILSTASVLSIPSVFGETGIQTVSVDVTQSYRHLPDYELRLFDHVSNVLERAGFKVADVDEKHDARLYIEIKGIPLAGTYGMGRARAWTGARAEGVLKVIQGEEETSVALAGEVPRLPTVAAGANRSPHQAPLQRACIKAISPSLMAWIGETKGAKALIALFDDWHHGHKAALEVARFGAIAVDPLLVALEHDNRAHRMRAAYALGQIGDLRAVEPLINGIEDDSHSVRRAAAEALGRLRDERAIDPLIRALSDTIPSVQKSAAAALGTIGDARAVEPLISALEDWRYGMSRASEKDGEGRVFCRDR